MGCWLFRGKVLILKSRLKDRLFFERIIMVGDRRVKFIKNTLSVFNPLKLVNLGVFRGFRDDFLD